MKQITISLGKILCLILLLIWQVEPSFAKNLFSVSCAKQSKPAYAAIKGGKLEYYQLGHGKPIVLISGFGASVSSWNRQFLVELAKQHEVIIVDNRNVGGSYVQSGSYTSQDLANDIYQLIKQLKLTKPAILGVSMGGMIAQQLAVLHPDNIGCLILVNTAISGKSAVPPTHRVEQMILHVPKGKIHRYFLAIRLLFPPSWWPHMAFTLERNHFKPQDQVENKISPTTLRQQQQLVLQWSTDNITAKKIAQLQIPTLILSGGADIIIPPINSDILHKAISYSRLVRFSEGGHGLLYQYPQQAAHSINLFLALKS